jgi:CheY-like chemotaxis protein
MESSFQTCPGDGWITPHWLLLRRFYRDHDGSACREHEGTRKKEFPVMLAHELRNARIPISNAVFLARHPAEQGASGRAERQKVMRRYVGTMTGLVEDLMDVTRQGAGRFGLNPARELIERHGVSREGSGGGPTGASEFVDRLRGEVRAMPLPAPSGSRANAPDSPARWRILVVDDNQDAARSLAKVLTVLYGQEVRVAHDGPTALAIADAFEPELVFLDIGLPGMSGLEIASLLRDRPWSGRCRIAAVTGRGQELDRQRSRAAGFDFHLVKPVRTDDLQKLLSGKIASWRE